MKKVRVCKWHRFKKPRDNATCVSVVCVAPCLHVMRTLEISRASIIGSGGARITPLDPSYWSEGNGFLCSKDEGYVTNVSSLYTLCIMTGELLLDLNE